MLTRRGGHAAEAKARYYKADAHKFFQGRGQSQTH